MWPPNRQRVPLCSDCMRFVLDCCHHLHMCASGSDRAISLGFMRQNKIDAIRLKPEGSFSHCANFEMPLTLVHFSQSAS